MSKVAISIIGHRGARAYAPENTLPAYAVALSQGVDSIDVDVVATSDKILIGYHDLLVNPDILCASNTGAFLASSKAEFLETLNQYNINNILIKNMSFDEISEKFNVKLNPSSPYSKWFPEQKHYPNTKLSSLQEIVDFINLHTDSTMPIQIEVKNSFNNLDFCYSSEELAEIVYEFILKNSLQDRIKVQAFDWRILAILNKFDPKIKTAYLFMHTTQNDWQKLFADSLVMEAAKNMKVKQLQFLPNLVKQLGGYSYEPEDIELTYENVKIIKKLGLKIFVWCWPEHSGHIYNQELYMKLIDWQIDGFITDKPRELRDLLYKMGYSVPKQIKL